MEREGETQDLVLFVFLCQLSLLLVFTASCAKMFRKKTSLFPKIAINYSYYKSSFPLTFWYFFGLKIALCS